MMMLLVQHPIVFIYFSQLMRFARVSSRVDDFNIRNKVFKNLSATFRIALSDP